MQVNFKGTPVNLVGHHVQVGDPAPDFRAVDKNLQDLLAASFEGKRVYVSIPSIDTPVCDMEVRRFNEEASKIDGVQIYVISMDLPFAQARWCGGAGIENVTLLSDFKYKNFGQNFGTYIEELGLLTRAVFVVDAHHEVLYAEYCKEVGEEPDYEAVLAALK